MNLELYAEIKIKKYLIDKHTVKYLIIEKKTYHVVCVFFSFPLHKEKTN